MIQLLASCDYTTASMLTNIYIRHTRQEFLLGYWTKDILQYIYHVSHFSGTAYAYTYRLAKFMSNIALAIWDARNLLVHTCPDLTYETQVSFLVTPTLSSEPPDNEENVWPLECDANDGYDIEERDIAEHESHESYDEQFMSLWACEQADLSDASPSTLT